MLFLILLLLSLGRIHKRLKIAKGVSNNIYKQRLLVFKIRLINEGLDY